MKGRLWFEPMMLDASVLTDEEYCQAIIKSPKPKFYISSTLYEFLCEKYWRNEVYTILNRFRPWQERGMPLPAPKLLDEFRAKLKPYHYKNELIKDIYDSYRRSVLPEKVKQIILDEWSFLKEESSILMRTSYFRYILHRWGIVIIDASNKVFDLKLRFVYPYRGLKWLLGIAIAISSLSQIRNKPKLAIIGAVGGVALALLDPHYRDSE